MSIPPILNRADASAYDPVAVGIDSLYLSSFYDGLGIDWEALRFEKEKLRATPGALHTELELGGERFALHRAGAKPYSFILSNRAFSLQLGQNIRPLCHAQFKSHLLWTSGLDAALTRYNRLWVHAGSKATRPDVVSRVDTAFDFRIGKPDFRTEHFVSQAKKDATWREDGAFQSVRFGNSAVVCRVYDKIAEIEQQSAKDWLFDLWGARDGVWRCEFQMRGERLKQAGIATVEHMHAHLPSLVRHLAKRHTSLRIAKTDTNRSRWSVHPMWKGLIASTNRLTTPPERTPPPLLMGSDYQLQRQVQSLLGDLKGIAATLSVNRKTNPVTLDELLERLPGLARPYHSPNLWNADVLEKLRKRELGL
ncbi:MAG TPA: hypothetical protein VIJ62_03475 [Rhizomicrobium sp.]